MYVGRIVCVLRMGDGRLGAGYRVSSRSFPNRTAVAGAEKVSIVPKAGFETDVQRNPYIAYNCVRLVCGGRVAVVSNGSHTDPIAEKVEQGMSARDALALSSLALDYEKDQFDTPRISALVDQRTDEAWLAVIRRDGLEVRSIPLAAGRFAYVATYEENSIAPAQSGDFTGADAASACAFLLGGGVFAERANPVAAVAAAGEGASFALHVQDAPAP